MTTADRILRQGRVGRPPPEGWTFPDNGSPVLVEALATGPMPVQDGAVGAPGAICAQPRAAIGPDGGPVLSLVLVLDRQPSPDNPSVVPLIRSSTVNFDVVLGLTDVELEALGGKTAPRPERLFLERVDYRFGRPVGVVAEPALAVGSAQGTVGRSALSTTLGRELTLDVLSALRGSPSTLVVDAVVRYSRPGVAQLLRLRAAWADIWDALAARTGDGTITGDTVALAVRGLIDDRRLEMTPAAASADPDDVARIVLAQSAVVLDRSDSAAWRLRSRPHPAVPFDYESKVTGRVAHAFTLSAPLQEILSPPLAGRSLDRYVSMVAPAPGGGTAPVAPRRTARHSRGDRDGAAGPVLTANSGRLESIALIAEPRRAATASAAFLASDAMRPAQLAQRPSALTHLPLDDLRVFAPADQVESLPVVEDPDAATWADRFTNGPRWYAPAMELVAPSPSALPDNSPFLFRFRRTGVTDDSRPALEATITATVRRVLPPGAAGIGSLSEVQPSGVTAALEVPFIDRTDGSAKRQVLQGQVTATDDGWRIEVRVVNDWVRICYRALSGTAAGAEPATLRVDYLFAGYSVIRRGNWEVALRPSVATLPVVWATRDLQRVDPEPVFDGRSLTLHTASAQISFRREDAAALQQARSANGHQVAGRAAAIAPRRPALQPDRGAIVAEKPITVFRPVVRPQEISIVADQITYAKRSFARRLTIPVRVECAANGSLYREATTDGDVAVGCRNEFQLGEIRYAVFAELTAISTDRYSVHRLLQQPGRFLAVPAQYGITRHEADEGPLAFRPCIVLYAVLDPDDAENNRVQLDATLQPAIGVDERSELMARLGTLDPAPQLLLPTEIEGVRATFQWAVPGTGAVVTTMVLTGGLLRVGIGCSIPDWLLLRTQLQATSVSGTATFDYPDGTSLRSAMTLDLTQILGPWESGPVPVALTGSTAVLTNRTEREVDVSDLICAAPDGRHRVAVARSLPAAGSTQVQVPPGTNSATPIVTLPRTDPVAIAESRSFVDSLETNVIFINLIALQPRGLTRLTVDARIRDVPGESSAQVTDQVSTAEVRFTLPLTTYLSVRVLQYRVTAHDTDGKQTAGGWSDWDLAARGNVVGLTFEKVQPTPDNNQGDVTG